MVDAQIEYYLKRDPDTLSDEEWATKWNNLLWIRKEEAKHNRGK